MSDLKRLAAYMYIHSKELKALDKKIKKVHAEVVEYSHKYHSAQTHDDKKKYHSKLEKHSKKYKELEHHRHKLLVKLHEFSAGFARSLQQQMHQKS